MNALGHLHSSKNAFKLIQVIPIISDYKIHIRRSDSLSKPNASEKLTTSYKLLRIRLSLYNVVKCRQILSNTARTFLINFEGHIFCGGK